MLCYGGVNKHWNYDLDFPITFKFLTNSKNLKESGCNSPSPTYPELTCLRLTVYGGSNRKIGNENVYLVFNQIDEKKTNKHLGIPISGYIQT